MDYRQMYMTGAAKQAFEVDLGFGSSNGNIILTIKNERSKRAILAALAENYKRS